MCNEFTTRYRAITPSDSAPRFTAAIPAEMIQIHCFCIFRTEMRARLRLVKLWRDVECPQLCKQRVPVDKIASIVECQILGKHLQFRAVGRRLRLPARLSQSFAQRLRRPLEP